MTQTSKHTMASAIPIVVLIGVLSSLWYLPYDLARDWWILGSMAVDLAIMAETWPSVLAEWIIRASGYSLAFGLFFHFRRQEPLFMSMVTVGLTMIVFPIGLFICISSGWNVHLIRVIESADAGLAGYGFAYITEFALIVTVQLTGWKLMELFGLGKGS